MAGVKYKTKASTLSAKNIGLKTSGKLFSDKITLDVFDLIFGQISDVIVRGKKSSKESGRKREPQNLSSLSSFCSHKISFYSDKYLNGSSSRISLLSIASMIEAFSKANLIISPEFRNLWYRLISRLTRIGFISDNLVSISI